MLECIKSLNQLDQSNLPFFAQENYLKTLSENYGWFKTDDFLLPFIERKRHIFRFVTFTNETIYLTGINDEKSEQAFLNEVVGYLKNAKCDFITQPPTNVLFKTYPDKSLYAEFGTYIVDLQIDEEALFNKIHPKHKNVIRKAIRDGIIIERGYNNKDICFEIINNTLQRQGISFQEKVDFERMIELMKDNTEIFIAKNNEQFEGAAIIPWDKNTAYYLYGGSSAKHHLGSMNLLHWEAMKYFKSIGVKEYNLVGARLKTESNSKIHGIQEFKRRFGAELRGGFLWKFNINPMKKALFDNLIFLKTRKRSADIIDYERK